MGGDTRSKGDSDDLGRLGGPDLAGPGGGGGIRSKKDLGLKTSFFFVTFFFSAMMAVFGRSARLAD